MLQDVPPLPTWISCQLKFAAVHTKAYSTNKKKIDWILELEVKNNSGHRKNQNGACASEINITKVSGGRNTALCFQDRLNLINDWGGGGVNRDRGHFLFIVHNRDGLFSIFLFLHAVTDKQRMKPTKRSHVWCLHLYTLLVHKITAMNAEEETKWANKKLTN